MKHIPRLGLRTVFLLFVCAAVGLTAGVPVRPVADDPAALVTAPQSNWQHGLLATASSAMVIGLGNQTWQLMSWRRNNPGVTSDLRFAVSFAVGWRAVVVLLLMVCTTCQMLIAQSLVMLPSSETYIHGDVVFPQIAWLITAMVVLATSAARGSGNQAIRPGPRIVRVTAWWAGGLLAALIYLDLNFVNYLVHIATAGIDATIPEHVNRPNVFPNHREEGFRSFWISLIAAACVLMAAASLSAANDSRRLGRPRRRLQFAIFAMLIVAGASYSIWFYRVEYHRISPDLAAAGIAASWTDLAGGAMLVGVLVTVGAFRMARPFHPPGVDDGNEGADRIVDFRESAWTTIAALPFVAIVVMYLVSIALLLLNRSMFSFGITIADLVRYSLQSPMIYIMLGIVVPSVQVCWQQLRRKNGRIAWRLTPIDRRAFLWNWLALALMAIVGIPTLSAFSFMIWLGPWWLFGK